MPRERKTQVQPSNGTTLPRGKAFQIRLMTALLEATFCFFEFLFLFVMAKDFGKNIYHEFSLTLPMWFTFLINVFANALVIYWTLWRFAYSIGLRPAQLASRLGLTSLRVSWTAVAIVGIQGLGAVIMVLLQLWYGRWIFSLKNYYTQEDKFEWTGVTEMLVLSPFREEIIFRGAMFSIFYRRIGGKSAKEKRLCIISSSLIFGLVHLLNLFGSEYSIFYIVLQVTLGIMVGALYNLRFVINGGLIETILLHMSNNVFSSFLNLNLIFDWLDPLIIFPLLETFIVYGLLIYFSHQELMKQKPMPYAPVDLDGSGTLKPEPSQNGDQKEN